MNSNLKKIFLALSIFSITMGCQQKGKIRKILKHKTVVESGGNKAEPSDIDPSQEKSEVSPNSSETIVVNTKEDSSSLELSFVVAGLTAPSASCNSNFLSYSSSNASLVPSQNAVSWGGRWPNCTAVFSPEANANGSSIIEIIARQGATSIIVKSFTLISEPVNDPPRITSVISPQMTSEDTALVVLFTADDLDGALTCTADHLQYSSDKASVVATSGAVSWSGTWPNCTGTITPVSNANGSANITFTISDGSLTASVLFAFTANAVDDKPLISDVANQSTNEDTALNSLTVTISDVDNTLVCATSLSGNSSNTTLLPNANITIGGTAPNCTVSLNPNIHQNGSATVTLTVIDGLLSEQDTFVLTVNAVNSTPIISHIANQSTNEDTDLNSIAVTVSDVDNTLVCATALSAASSNTTLLASANIIIGGTAPNCLVNISPSANQSGTSAITVTVTDGNSTATDTFTLTVISSNDAPVISDVPDQITTEYTALTGVAVTISDTETEMDCNTITASSSNTTLITEGNITISGTAPYCLVSMLPVLNQNGFSTITLTVSDGSLAAIDTYTLTVTAVNNAPMISDVADQTTTEDTALNVVAVSIMDEDSTLSCSDISSNSSDAFLIPLASITISGTVPNCLVNLDPALNQSGTSTITLTVTDGTLSAMDSFVVTVDPVNDSPTDMSISSLILDENSGENAVLGDLSATDPDTSDTFSYDLITGAGSTDNSSFDIVGNQILMRDSSDFETKSTYEIRVRATDQGSLFFEKQLTINITNVNEAPRIASIVAQTTIQDTTSSVIPLTITDVDGPAGTCNATYLSYTSQTISVVASTGAVSWSGTWPNCTAVITPENSSTGSSVIAFSVSDGSLTSSAQSFILNVGGSLGWAQEAYIKASNADATDFFGNAVSISGDTAIVGAHWEASNQTTITNSATSSPDNSLAEVGASYIYKRTGSTWVQEAYLKASNADTSDHFGNAVSISGDTAIVGSYGESSNETTITNGTTSSLDNSFSSSGTSYVYKRTGSIWVQEAYLKASNADASDCFGASVSISGNTAIVGSNWEGSNATTITNSTISSVDNTSWGSGASYIYKRTGSTWEQEAYLKASNADVFDWFGYAVSISGDTAIVGAYLENSNETTITNGTTSSPDNSFDDAGASYIYKRTGSTWVQEAYIKASNADGSDNFGYVVSISGDTAIVGAHWEASNETTITNGTTSSLDNTHWGSGASYIYKRTGSSWLQEAYLKASNAEASDYFGIAVSTSGDTAIVGAFYEGSNQTTITNGLSSSLDNTSSFSGASYIYKRTGSSWVQEAYLKASNANAGDNFGRAVSISGDTVIVGSAGEASNQSTITNGTTSSLDDTAGGAGAVYVYRNLSRMFEAYEIESEVSSTSFTINWKGSSLGSAIGNFKVVYSTTTPGPNCSDGTVAYTGSATSVSVDSGLIAGQSYIVRICAFDGTDYSEGITTEITVKGDDVGPTVLSITRGSTTNPVPFGTNVIDYIVTFNESVIGLNPYNFSFTEVTTITGATGRISSVSCTEAVCEVWVLTENTGQLRLDLTNTAGVVDNWGNPLSATKTGDEVFTLEEEQLGWAQEAYLKASNANAVDRFGVAVSISGDTAIVGAHVESSNQTTITNGTIASPDNSLNQVGATYIYKRTGSSWVQEAYIKASNADSFDYLGYAVAISGDTAIVGAYLEDSSQTTITNGTTSNPDNTASGAGASYIYKRTGSSWAQEAYIKASNANAVDRFGVAVSISGDTAIVGAYMEASSQTTITNDTTSSLDNSSSSAGASYIYKRTGYSWAQEAYIKASNANGSDYFGNSVSISSDTAIVGADGEASNQSAITNGPSSSLDNTASVAGASYIYKRTGSSWAQEAYLKASNANASDSFGLSISISGDTVLVGAFQEDSNQITITNDTTSSLDNSASGAGAGYIYKRTGSSWFQEAYLKASNANGSDYFGKAVSISGDTAIVGAQGEGSNQTTITNGKRSSLDNSASNAGASYIYKRTGSSWTQEAYLKASNANAGDLFAGAVSISGDTVTVGAHSESSNQTVITNGASSSLNNGVPSSGAVYVYRNIERIFNPDLRVSAKTTTSITLSWGSSLGTTNRVKIAPAVSGGGEPLPCTDASAIALTEGVTSYTYSGLTPSTKYGFRVCGFDFTNVSEGSVIRENTD